MARQCAVYLLLKNGAQSDFTAVLYIAKCLLKIVIWKGFPPVKYLCGDEIHARFFTIYLSYPAVIQQIILRQNRPALIIPFS